MLWMRIKNLWLLIQLKFYSALLSILSGFTCKLKVKHDGAVIARDRLKDGRVAETYIKDGKYERRIIEDFDSYHFDVNCASLIVTVCPASSITKRVITHLTKHYKTYAKRINCHMRTGTLH